jgi:hypothetical protein
MLDERTTYIELEWRKANKRKRGSPMEGISKVKRTRNKSPNTP